MSFGWYECCNLRSPDEDFFISTHRFLFCQYRHCHEHSNEYSKYHYLHVFHLSHLVLGIQSEENEVDQSGNRGIFLWVIFVFSIKPTPLYHLSRIPHFHGFSNKKLGSDRAYHRHLQSVFDNADIEVKMPLGTAISTRAMIAFKKWECYHSNRAA